MLQSEKGRPADITGRLQTEIAVYDLLDRLEIDYARIDHNAVYTMRACQEIDSKLVPATICKNLFLCNRQQTEFYLLMICDGKRFNTKEVSSQLGVSRLSFAPSELLPEYLGLTQGSVSVLGLMNDRESRVKLLIDRDILASEYFGCHPCINTTSLRLKISDLLEKILPAIRHGYTPVTIS